METFFALLALFFQNATGFYKNQHGNTIINSVHAPPEVNICSTYEQDPWNIVGCRAVTIGTKSLLVCIKKIVNATLSWKMNINTP